MHTKLKVTIVLWLLSLVSICLCISKTIHADELTAIVFGLLSLILLMAGVVTLVLCLEETQNRNIQLDTVMQRRIG